MNAGTNTIRARLARLWQRLTEPTAAVTDPVEQRDARLLAAVMLAFLALFWPTTLALFARQAAAPPCQAVTLISGLLAIGAYRFSRTPHYRQVVVAITVGVGILVLAMLATDIVAALEANVLMYFMLAVVLTGLLLSVRATLVAAAAALALLALALVPPALTPLAASAVQADVVVAGLGVALAVAQRSNRRTIAQQAYTLAENEISHRALFEALTDPVLVHQRGIIVQANPAFGELVGCDVAELLGQPALSFIAPASRAQLALKIQSRHVECYEALGMNCAGSIIPVEISSRPYIYRGQHLRVSVIRDIRVRKAMEQALAEERGLLQTVINTIPDQLYVKNTDGRIILVNQAALRRHNFTRPDDMLGKTDFDLFAPDVAQRFHDDEQALMASGTLTSATIDAHDAAPGHAPLWLQVTKVPLHDSAGHIIGILSLNRDITDSRRAEQQRLDLALQRQQVEILRRFIAGLSHDLNTPITVLKTGTYLLRRSLDDPAQRESRLDMFETYVDRLAALVAELLDVESVERGTLLFDFAPAVPDALLAPVIAAGEALAAQREQTFAAVVEPGLPPVRVDASLLRRALDNLVANAVQYTPAHGTITLDARRARDRLSIAVHDTGIGIELADLAHIFEGFYRADKARSSETGRAGLGLTIARRIALAHGGDIQVASTPGAGSTFTLWLPCAPDGG